MIMPHEMLLRHYSADPLAFLPVGLVHEQHAPGSDHAFKPKGLWVSHEAVETSWRDWCVSEDFRHATLTRPVRVRVRPGSDVLVLRSVEDLRSFTARYGRPHKLSLLSQLGHLNIDWHAVARDHQGIIITPYQWECRMNRDMFWYYPWDCASGCIWDTSIIEDARMECVPKLTIPATPFTHRVRLGYDSTGAWASVDDPRPQHQRVINAAVPRRRYRFRFRMSESIFWRMEADRDGKVLIDSASWTGGADD